MTPTDPRAAGTAPVTERDLIRRARDGDEDASRRLFERHRTSVLAVVRRRVSDPDTIDDLVQQTFIRAFGALRRFRGEAAFGTWITRIAINVCLSHRRAERVRRTWITLMEDLEYAKEAVADVPREPDPMDTVLADERRDLILEGIRRLPERYREAVWLRYVKDRSYEEITHVLQVPTGTVKTWLHRARRQLATEYRRLGLQPV